jgi:LAS superfamily LD-carboxypeptidase LdcB
MGKPMRPDVALAFDRLAAAARSEAGLSLLVTSGYRSDAEQAKLFAAKPMPHLFSAL